MKREPVASRARPTTTSARTVPVTVDIDELVLSGFDRVDAAEFASALRDALIRALAAHGPPPGWTGGEPGDAHRPHTARLEISVRAGDSPAAIAETLAARLCAGTATSPGEQP